MSKREYRFSNMQAAKLPREELVAELRTCFQEHVKRAPSREEEAGLKEAAEWVKDGSLNWRAVERGLRDGTWLPEEGAGSIHSDG
jgi:hypothetical protein